MSDEGVVAGYKEILLHSNVESSSTQSGSSANLYLVGVVAGLLASWALYFLSSALFGFILLSVVLISFVAYVSSKNTSADASSSAAETQSGTAYVEDNIALAGAKLPTLYQYARETYLLLKQLKMMQLLPLAKRLLV